MLCICNSNHAHLYNTDRRWVEVVAVAAPRTLPMMKGRDTRKSRRG